MDSANANLPANVGIAVGPPPVASTDAGPGPQRQNGAEPAAAANTPPAAAEPEIIPPPEEEQDRAAPPSRQASPVKEVELAETAADRSRSFTAEDLPIPRLVRAPDDPGPPEPEPEQADRKSRFWPF
jgi:hypothetical protein